MLQKLTDQKFKQFLPNKQFMLTTFEGRSHQFFQTELEKVSETHFRATQFFAQLNFKQAWLRVGAEFLHYLCRL